MKTWETLPLDVLREILTRHLDPNFVGRLCCVCHDLKATLETAFDIWEDLVSCLPPLAPIESTGPETAPGTVVQVRSRLNQFSTLKRRMRAAQVNITSLYCPRAPYIEEAPVEHAADQEADAGDEDADQYDSGDYDYGETAHHIYFSRNSGSNRALIGVHCETGGSSWMDKWISRVEVRDVTDPSVPEVENLKDLEAVHSRATEMLEGNHVLIASRFLLPSDGPTGTIEINSSLFDGEDADRPDKSCLVIDLESKGSFNLDLKEACTIYRNFEISFAVGNQHHAFPQIAIVSRKSFWEHSDAEDVGPDVESPAGSPARSPPDVFVSNASRGGRGGFRVDRGRGGGDRGRGGHGGGHGRDRPRDDYHCLSVYDLLSKSYILRDAAVPEQFGFGGVQFCGRYLIETIGNSDEEVKFSVHELERDGEDRLKLVFKFELDCGVGMRFASLDENGLATFVRSSRQLTRTTAQVTFVSLKSGKTLFQRSYASGEIMGTCGRLVVLGLNRGRDADGIFVRCGIYDVLETPQGELPRPLFLMHRTPDIDFLRGDLILVRQAKTLESWDFSTPFIPSPASITVCAVTKPVVHSLVREQKKEWVAIDADAKLVDLVASDLFAQVAPLLHCRVEDLTVKRTEKYGITYASSQYVGSFFPS